jgi:hypothetical protein
MKNNKSTLRKYLLNVNDKDMSVNTVVRLKKILNECICDFQEQEDCQKIEILKNILLLLTKLVFDDQEISIVINQEYNNDSCVDTQQTMTGNNPCPETCHA